MYYFGLLVLIATAVLYIGLYIWPTTYAIHSGAQGSVYFNYLPSKILLREWSALHVLTSKCASRHSRVHFSTSKLPKMVRTCVFVSAFWLRNRLRATTACNVWSLIRPHGSAPAALASLLFDPPKPQNIGKVVCLHLLSTDSFSSDSLSSVSFSSLTALTAVAASVHKSEVWLLTTSCASVLHCAWWQSAPWMIKWW